ncbi:MAG: Oxidoreductase [Candidatus Acidoferrum typicum]|nr:Oxidoreductase [Candidatus Acidoferrum typicum]
MGLSITQIDAFAEKPFSGNPAAVCLLEKQADENWMQLVAREMNLSETAFLLQRDGGFDLRWFTPMVEVSLCGHATLASAHFLWEGRQLSPDQPARFFTKSGVLTAIKKGTLIEMDFPASPVSPEGSFEELESALGIKARYVGRSGFDYLVEVESEEAVRALKPDFDRIAQLKVRGVIVTSQANGSGYDFVSRFFAPAVGVNEDPVTGSAHCCLGPFWKERLGRDDLVGYQASARGGFVRTRCVGDRVLISGQAVTVMRGELV